MIKREQRFVHYQTRGICVVWITFYESRTFEEPQQMVEHTQVLVDL